MANGYIQAIQGESYDIDDVFKELEKEKQTVLVKYFKSAYLTHGKNLIKLQ